MATVGKMRSQFIKGQAEKYLEGGATDPTDDLKRQAAGATQQATAQALGAQQRGLARAAQAQTGGSPIAPGGMAAGAQALGRESAEAAAKGTTEANKLAAAVREKRRAQALAGAERLSAERWQKGMDIHAIYKDMAGQEAAAEAASTIAGLVPV